MPRDKPLIYWIIASIVISVLVIHYGEHDDIVYFMRSLPNITGLLLTGILTSLAIIFGLVGVDELMKIREIEKTNDINLYDTLINDVRDDVYLIIASVAGSTLISVFSKNCNSVPITISTTEYVLYLYDILFILDAIILVVSLIVVHDVIMALFNISKLRYELVKNK